MKKPAWFIVIIAVVIIGLAALALLRRGGGSSITIGIVLPLSGGMAEFGENGRNGALLAVEELESEGFEIELIAQDTEGSPAGTVAAVRRLIDVNGAKFIMGGLTSSGVLAAAPYAQERGVLFFSPAASALGIPEIGDLVFRNWQSDTALASLFAEWTRRDFGAEALRILHVSNDYGKTNADTFRERFEALGGVVVLSRAFSQGETDFRNLITELRAAGSTDAVLLVAYPDEYRGIFRELALQELGSQLLATDTFYSPDLVAQIGSAGEGVICAAASKPGDDYAPRRTFVEKYRQRFSSPDGQPEAPGLVSDTAYDAIRLLADGIRATDGSPQAVANWLLNVRGYQGAVGPTTFTETGDVEGGMSVYRVVQGEFRLVEK